MIQISNNIPAIDAIYHSLAERNDIRISIEILPDIDPSLAGFAKGSDEKYVLNISESNGTINADIKCINEKSAFYAVSDVYYRDIEGTLQPGTHLCSPSFAKRGYIEGFYGKPWSYSQRLSFLTKMVSKRMNTVFYAPKDDEYHRSKWDILYPEDELTKLKKLSDDAASFYMDFNWCIAPGLSIKYSDNECFEKLIDKVKQIYSVGIRGFGLLLDDIDPELFYEEDKARYSSLVSAHTDLINRFYNAVKEIDGSNHLTVCPTVYHGKGTEEYISRLGKGIPGDISIFWTGRDICSRDITTDEAIRFLNGTGHKPLYWDNYPVNDCAMKNEMHMSAVINRDPDLCRFSEGIISNCMEYCECSKIPVMTAADYLWNSYEYSPDRSLCTALKATFGNDADSVSVFADLTHTSCLLDDNAVSLTSVFEKAAKYVRNNETDKASSEISEYAKLISGSADTLKKYTQIYEELSEWISKFETAADILNAFADYLILPGENGLSNIKAIINSYDSNPRRLTEDYYFESEINYVLDTDLL